MFLNNGSFPGFGWGKNNYMGVKIPYINKLDQVIRGDSFDESGLLPDKFGNYPAQLVEQPCGVFTVDSTVAKNWMLDKILWTIAVRINNFTASGLTFIAGSTSGTRAILAKHSTSTYVGYRSTDGNFHDFDGSGNTSAVAVNDGDAHTLVFFSDGTNVFLVADGVYSGYITPASVLLKIYEFGQGYGTSTYAYVGDIWDFRLWDTNIGQAEALNYHSNKSMTTPNIVWIPDPSTGYDISGNANHGTVTDITVGTQDETAVIQSVGFNKYIKCLTNGTIRIKYEGAYTYKYYDYSTDTWSDESGTVTAGNYFELAIEVNDLVGLIKVGGVYPSQDVADWNIVSGTFENHLVPADLSAPTYDVLGNPLHYLPKGILPLGAIEFNPDDTNPTPAVLRLFDRDNTIGQIYQYWKEEIKLLNSYNASHPERHDLDELTNGDYIRVFGTQLLIQRLFLKAFKTDDDWTAISNILNYSAVLDATERQKVFNYLKDPSKENQEAWELYQGSSVVAAYRFDQPLSLFNEDGELCKLGWEGEKLGSNMDFTAWTGDDPDDWNVSEVGDPTSNVTQNGNACRIISDGTSTYISQAILEIGKYYDFSIDITDVTDGGIDVYGFGTAIRYTTTGIKIITRKATSTELQIYRRAGEASDITFTDIIAKEVGAPVSKVLDVGSGGGDGLTYYNLTQSDLSKQGKRIAGGIELNADAEYAIDAAMNGKECYIEEMDGTFTAHFTVASSKITATEIYAEISSYEVKSLKLITP